MELHERVVNDFAYHAPRDEGTATAHEVVRAVLKETADELIILCPESRELSLALTKLEEAMMWANAAIARNQ